MRLAALVPGLPFIAVQAWRMMALMTSLVARLAFVAKLPRRLGRKSWNGCH